MQEFIARSKNSSSCFEKVLEKYLEFDSLNGRGFKDETTYLY